MGKRGPCPLPTPVLKVRGSWRAKTRKNEPTPETGRPEQPNGMPVPVAKVWHALLDKLEKMPGVLATCDGGQLERYCENFVIWYQTRDAIRKLGDNRLTIAVGEKTKLVYPELLKEMLKLDAALKQVEREFHLTPSARARVGLMNAIASESSKEKQGLDRYSV